MDFQTRTFRGAPRASALLAWGLLAGIAVPAAAQDPALALEHSLTTVIEQAEPAVVSIARIRPIGTFDGGIIATRPMERPDGRPIRPDDPDFQPNSFGAGILIAGLRPQERMVLTNYHVVQGGPVYSRRSGEAANPFLRHVPPTGDKDGVPTQLFVHFSDRRSCYASIVAADPRSDLAVLALDLDGTKIDAADLKTLDWTATPPVRKGQLVVMLGNPYALAYDGSASASWGMVSNLARRPLPWTDDRISRTTMYRLGNLIQIDGRLNLGTSGGPLLNLKGELVGLTTSLAAVEGYEKSAGFAIPLDGLTRRIVKSLVHGYEVEYGVLGVAPQSVSPTDFRDLNTGLKHPSAAQVASVTPDSPAYRAGIRKDDVVLAVGDTPIYSEYDLMRVIGLHAPESKVEVLVWRKELGRTLTLEAVLGKWPVMDDEGIISTTPRYPSWRGISVDFPTGRRQYHRDNDPYRRAVVVTRAEGAAQAAGIQPGMFIAEVHRMPVQTPAEFVEATRGLRGPVELRLYEGTRITIGE